MGTVDGDDGCSEKQDNGGLFTGFSVPEKEFRRKAAKKVLTLA